MQPNSPALLARADRLERGAAYADGAAWSHDRQRATRLREQVQPAAASRLSDLARRIAAEKAARAREQAQMDAVAAQLRARILAGRVAVAA